MVEMALLLRGKKRVGLKTSVDKLHVLGCGCDYCTSAA